MNGKPIPVADLNSGFVVAISIVAKDGEGDAVAAILAEITPPSLAEPGIKVFLPYRSPTDPNSFFIYELYRDELAWKEHQETEHFRRLIPEIVKRVSKRERVPYVPYVKL